jgi:hypothetical protein
MWPAGLIWLIIKNAKNMEKILGIVAEKYMKLIYCVIFSPDMRTRLKLRSRFAKFKEGFED